MSLFIRKVRKLLGSSKKRQKLLQFYSEFVSKGDLIFDAGANRGTYTKVFLQLGAKVIAIDPQESSITQLNKIASGNLTVVPVAISDENGTALFLKSSEDEVSTLSEEFKDELVKNHPIKYDKGTQVKTKTLDSLIEEYGCPHYLKIDIEGYEHIALKSLSHQVQILSFEFIHTFRHYAIDCVTLIEKNGEYVYNYYPFEHLEFELDSWVSGSEMKEIINHLNPKYLGGDIYARLKN